ncbi:MAG: gliding motility protein GldN [Nonlabens sp.]
MKKVVLFAFMLISGYSSIAQENILNAKSVEELEEMRAEEMANSDDTPLPYGYLAERDILWRRTVWENIDLDERVNFPLYYPVDTVRIDKSRRSLYDVLTKAARTGEISLFGDSYFNEKVAVEDIDKFLETEQLSPRGTDILNENGIYDLDAKPSELAEKYNLEDFEQYVTVTTISSADVMSYHTRGIWYFDTKQSELRYRMIAIAPVTPDVNIKAGIITDDGNSPGVELFWVYLPEARNILHKAKAFNGRNSARPISFDHILNSRRFSATIYQVDNVQGDRSVDRYIADNAMMQLLEADRLKEEIRNFELDMWNY